MRPYKGDFLVSVGVGDWGSGFGEVQENSLGVLGSYFKLSYFPAHPHHATSHAMQLK